MDDATKTIATAQRLIEKHGRPVTLVEFDDKPQDTARPWLGQVDPRDDPASERTMDAVFVPPSGASSLGLSMEVSDLVKRSEQIAIVSPGADVDLRVFNEVRDSEEHWKIEAVEVLKPAHDVLLAYVGLKR